MKSSDRSSNQRSHALLQRILMVGITPSAHYAPLELAYSLSCVETASEAITALNNDVMAAVLIAFELPDQSGPTLCSTIRKSPQWKNLPLVMVGSSEAVPELINAYDQGASDCYFVDSDIRELINKLHTQITLVSLREALSASLDREDQILALQQKQWEHDENIETFPSPQRKKVLIVDDSIASIEILDSILSDENDLYFATNGEEALRLGREIQPHLIMLDILLPDIDGYHLCRRFKEQSTTEDTPIVFVTSLDSADDEAKGLEAGAIDYIVKPYRPTIVKARVRNLLELVSNRDLLKKLSLTDALTQIPNRRSFEEIFRREWFRACRHNETLAVIMIDIDNFKKYNDHNGHPQGDVCLQKVASALYQNRKRSTDYVARLGGEEFVALLSNTSQETAHIFAQNLLESVRHLCIPHAQNTPRQYVTISAGMQLCKPVQTMQREMLLQRADEQLYQAKQAGRDRLQIAPAIEDVN